MGKLESNFLFAIIQKTIHGTLIDGLTSTKYANLGFFRHQCPTLLHIACQRSLWMPKDYFNLWRYRFSYVSRLILHEIALLDFLNKLNLHEFQENLHFLKNQLSPKLMYCLLMSRQQKKFSFQKIKSFLKPFRVIENEWAFQYFSLHGGYVIKGSSFQSKSSGGIHKLR